MAEILVVEDDRDLARGMELGLREADRVFTLCHDLACARRACAQRPYDLMILDITLPDGSGLDFCRDVRGAFAAPILFLTANDTELDIVAGLETGGDDYVTKPFSLAVLRARVNALLRRTAAPTGALRFGDLVLDFERLRFTKAGEPIELSRAEQRLLRVLTGHPGQTIPRDRLMDAIWSTDGAFVDENALSVTLSRLRGKLEDDPVHPRYIKTVRGIGYAWTAPC